MAGNCLLFFLKHKPKVGQKVGRRGKSSEDKEENKHGKGRRGWSL
jgi:hypothetical protein